MKIVVVKRIIFLLVFLFGYSAVNATDADLITKQITISKSISLYCFFLLALANGNRMHI